MADQPVVNSPKEFFEKLLPEGFATAISIREQNISQPKRQFGKVIGSMLPLLRTCGSAGPLSPRDTTR